MSGASISSASPCDSHRCLRSRASGTCAKRMCVFHAKLGSHQADRIRANYVALKGKRSRSRGEEPSCRRPLQSENAHKRAYNRSASDPVEYARAANRRKDKKKETKRMEGEGEERENKYMRMISSKIIKWRPSSPWPFLISLGSFCPRPLSPSLLLSPSSSPPPPPLFSFLHLLLLLRVSAIFTYRYDSSSLLTESNGSSSPHSKEFPGDDSRILLHDDSDEYGRPATRRTRRVPRY